MSLVVDRIQVVYNKYILGVKNVSLKAEEGKITALMGPNGAGKSTTLKAISGVAKLERGEVTMGKVIFEGTDITNKHPEEVLKLGLLQVLEGRRVFEELTVEDHLKVAERTARRLGRRPDREVVFQYFPRLRELMSRRAGYLSGGEQQMLVIGMALAIRPRVILLDEPSLGLSPKAVDDLFQVLKQINRNEGITILLAEQNVAASLEIAHYGYILENGRVVLDGPATSLRDNPDVKEFYMGLKAEGYKNVKYWKRKKRYL
ncbi:ABC transporter ATP-binding protein [Pyrobaculum ferrireducens]|uniref:ABC transporter ATP-binding component n=1 Tax=Pyrobaculum ferrireducens TaxID=1104324 RepID=G7VCG2_9CREN|nr:ABC transporter ATP-binding protein [Pyrobaculum ferrireducens]AET32582.1 ABC transporter ATP-binding component [Pyrobaculum ferrireducens]